ncbi:MAG: hypothetical protein OEY29_15650 [Gammaproteobacteria bacterium]|nr:hypothetical protein [Gammaproteobacteria bacterium]
MAKKLILFGRVKTRINKEPVYIGAGTDTSSVDLSDIKKFGLNEKDVDRIVKSGNGKIHDDDAIPMARLNELVDAVRALDPENKDDFTESGMPEVAAIKELVEGQVTADERDQAWEEYQRRYPEAE